MEPEPLLAREFRGCPLRFRQVEEEELHERCAPLGRSAMVEVPRSGAVQERRRRH